MVRLDRRLFVHLHDRHFRRPRQDFRQGAGVRRRQVLHHDERHAGIGWQRLEQLRQRIQPAGRCADADDRERLTFDQHVEFVLRIFGWQRRFRE